VTAVPSEFPFGFIKALPPAYWAAVLLSVVLLFLAIASHERKYLWISALFLTILIPGLGDLTHPYPRDMNTTVTAEHIVRGGGFSPVESVFLNFPGAAIVFSFLMLTTGEPSYLVIRAFGLLYNIIVLGLSYLFFRRTAMGQTHSILSALLVVACFYYQGVLIYTSLMGFIFYIAIAGIVFGSRLGRIDYFLLLLFFASMVLSHAYSPFLTLTMLVALSIGWPVMHTLLRRMKLERYAGEPPSIRPQILPFAITILAAYWIYFASTPFLWAVGKLESLRVTSQIGAAELPILSPQTVFAADYSHLTELYAPLLFFSFAAYLLLVHHDGRKLQSILWIIGLGGAVFFSVAGYVSEFIARIFSFAILPLSYGIGRIFDLNKRLLPSVGIIVMLVAFGLHLPAHYGQDAFLIYGDSTVVGIRFLANHSFSNASVDAPIRELSDHFYIDIYRTWDGIGPGSYNVLSYPSANWVLYSEGQTALGELTGKVESSNYDRVYSAGEFEICLENEF
jgi:hypothetical protein